MVKQNFVIIGAVAAGMSAASKIRTLNPEANIQVFEKNNYVSYIACGMPYFIEGSVSSINDLMPYDIRFFKEKRNIDVMLRHEATRISPPDKIIFVKDSVSNNEMSVPYDRLLIATGARPVIPPIEGINLPGIFQLRKLDDGIAIRNYIKENQPHAGLIMGAGSIGMEMAEAFSKLNVSTVIVEKMPGILGTMDDEINEVIEQHLKAKNVTLIKSKAVAKFSGSSNVTLTVLEDGEKFETDIALVSTGIKPNVELAVEAGIEISKTGAIKVNESMETSLADIYAAGDCTEAYHLVLARNVFMPLGTTANKQGRIAGENMAGGTARFRGIAGTSIFRVFDLEVGRTGLTGKDARKEGFDFAANVIEHFSKAQYFPGTAKIRIKLLADRKDGKLLGAQMVGENGVAKRLDVFATAIAAGMTVKDITELDLSYAPPFAPVYDPILIAAYELLKKL